MRTRVIQFVATVVLAVSVLSGCATTHTAKAPGPTASDSAITLQPDRLEKSASIRPVSFEDEEVEAADISFAQSAPMVKLAEHVPIGDWSAQPNHFNGQSLDLETLLGMAISANPAVQQAEAAAAQASGVHCQVGLKPNPTVGYFGQEMGNDGAGGQHGLFASQTIVRGDKLNWNRCVTSHDVNRLRWEAEAQRRRIETDVRMRFYRALAAQRKLKQAENFRLDAAKAVEVAEKRLDAEEGAKPDLLQSQLLVDQIDLSIRQSELEWQAAWAEIAATVGQPQLEASELTGDFVSVDNADAEALYQQVVSASPQLSAAKARIERARTNLQRQQNQPIPNLNVQLGVGVDTATDDAFANVQLGMPIPVHNQNQGNVSAARAEYTAACKNLQRLELKLRRDLAEVYRQYQAAAVAVVKYETTMLPRAEESLALVEKARSAGDIDFLRVLTARQTLFNLQQQLIAAQGQLSQADAEITGFLLTDALGTEITFEGDDGLRGQALSGQ